MTGFNTIWKSKAISINTKLAVLRACVASVLLCACETWTIRKQDVQRLLACEIKWYRRIMNIRWQQRTSNEEIRLRLKINKDIMQTIIERKVNLFGHTCRMNDNRLIKTIIFGMINEASKRGRPAREWLDDIRDWCNQDIHTLSQMAQDRTEWRETVNHACDTNGH